jgi:hypothetical protein
MTTSTTTVKLWNEVTDTQSEAINGGVVAFNNSFFSKLTDQANAAAVIASGNAIGNFNSAGASVTQSNQA